MGIMGIVSSDSELNQIIEETFKREGQGGYQLSFITDEQEVMEFISYELPEIVVFNFSDDQVDYKALVDKLETDAWLHNFGIIGIYRQEKQDEEELLEELSNINVLSLLNFYRVRSHLVKNVQIIEENYQIIFQKNFSSTLMDTSQGFFELQNDILAVPIYAGIASTLLFQNGYIKPETRMHFQLALAELIVNGIEHGNCQISYEEKTAGMEEGLSVVDLVAQKCQDPVINAKKVVLEWELCSDSAVFAIKDEGPGFNVEEMNRTLREQDSMSLHGRGIRMARALAKDIYYNGTGNKVTMVIENAHFNPETVPSGFSEAQVLNVKKGDLVFREGEESDYLYYISSGEYNVYHKRKKVGSLSAADMFMGEMSFLLNKTRSATIRAKTEGKLVKVSRKRFVSAIQNYPYYGIFLSKLLAKRLTRANEQNVQMAELYKKIEDLKRQSKP